MNRSSNILALSLVAVFGATGCLEEAVAQVETQTEAAPLATTAPVADTAEAKEEHGKRGRRAGRDRSTPVFLDGEIVGSLRFRELPPTLPIHWVSLDNETVARRFAIGDYIAAMGIELADVKAVHFHGGRRITTIDGDEVRAKADKIHFEFSRNTAGRPAYRYEGPIKANTAIDKITKVAIYVNKVAPTMKSGTLYVDGVAQTGMPYAKDVKTGGTRVYVDGRIVAHLKRRHVEDAEAKDLASVLRSLDIAVDDVKSAQIVSRDELATELTAADFSSKSLTVGATKRGTVSVGNIADGAGVDAILLFANQKPVDRTVDVPANLRMSGLRPVIDDAK